MFATETKPLPETQHDSEAVPLSAVFTPQEALWEAAGEAIESGRVTVERVDDKGEHDTIVTLANEDVDIAVLPGHDKQLGFTRPLSVIPLVPKKQAAVNERADQAVIDKAEEVLAKRSAWYLQYDMIKKNIEADGQLQQYAEFVDAGSDNRIALLNMSERTLTEDELEGMRHVVEAVSQRTNGALFKQAKYIVVQDEAYFPPGKHNAAPIKGESVSWLGTIRLNASIFDDEETKQFKDDVDTTLAQNVITHELYHQVGDSTLDGFDETSRFAAATGWRFFSDQDGAKEWMDELPSTSWVYKDGEYIEVPTGDLIQPGEEVGPVSWYGKTAAKEDAPEAFIPYVHSANRTAVDGIRRNVLDNKMRNIIHHSNQEEGPRFVRIIEHSPGDAHFGGVEIGGKPIRVTPKGQWEPDPYADLRKK